jgi:hypothetical protein
MLAIPATQEMRIEGLASEASRAKKARPYLKNKSKKD